MLYSHGSISCSSLRTFQDAFGQESGLFAGKQTKVADPLTMVFVHSFQLGTLKYLGVGIAHVKEAIKKRTSVANNFELIIFALPV